MFYPAVDYLVIILLLAFLMVTLFACIFCLRHEYIRKESEKRKKDFFKKKELNITEFSWFRYNQHNETGINITMDKTIIVMVAVNGRMFSKKYSITSLTFDTKILPKRHYMKTALSPVSSRFIDMSVMTGLQAFHRNSP